MRRSMCPLLRAEEANSAEEEMEQVRFLKGGRVFKQGGDVNGPASTCQRNLGKKKENSVWRWKGMEVKRRTLLEVNAAEKKSVGEKCVDSAPSGGGKEMKRMERVEDARVRAQNL